MAGWLSNGMPLIEAHITNTTTNTPGNGLVTQASSSMLVPLDTGLASGAQNQTAAATAFQIAAVALSMIANTATSTVAAATLNTVAGTVTTEALTTAAGATYVFTLTNSLLSTSVAAPQVRAAFKSCTAGALEVTSVVNGSGNCVITLTNIGTAALNGTILIGFHI